MTCQIGKETREKLVLTEVFMPAPLFQDRELKSIETWWLVLFGVFWWPWALLRNSNAPISLCFSCTFLHVISAGKEWIPPGIRLHPENWRGWTHVFDLLCLPSLQHSISWFVVVVCRMRPTRLHEWLGLSENQEEKQIPSICTVHTPAFEERRKEESTQHPLY